MVVLRYYNKRFHIFRKGIQKKRIQDTSTIKNEKFSNPPKKKEGNILIYFISFWRHGRVVRRGTANPFSSVQIWVSPDQQKTRNPLFFRWDSWMKSLTTSCGRGRRYFIYKLTPVSECSSIQSILDCLIMGFDRKSEKIKNFFSGNRNRLSPNYLCQTIGRR